ncbi:alpha/beta fold hydrolase [Streptomyces sp. NPDC059740]|uniref:alpha/beta fold hydrolase n=1 Tax=Streptomyces sp. NPDC059740 TaxID=3346926 RepID=UPI00364EC94E
MRGRRGGAGLALAHGAGGSVAANYTPILEGLADSRLLVGVDYPGAGGTPLQEAPLTLDQLAGELVAAAVDEGLERFPVLGYSLGAPVAMRAAALYPERVTGLVLTAPFARPNTRLRLIGTLWRELHMRGADHDLATLLLPQALGSTTLEALSDAEVATAIEETARTIPPGTSDHVDLVTRVDIGDDLPRLGVPTLVISTTEDLLVTEDLHREVAEAVPGAELARLATGHLPFTEAPGAWCELVGDFLERQGL